MSDYRAEQREAEAKLRPRETERFARAYCETCQTELKYTHAQSRRFCGPACRRKRK